MNIKEKNKKQNSRTRKKKIKENNKKEKLKEKKKEKEVCDVNTSEKKACCNVFAQTSPAKSKSPKKNIVYTLGNESSQQSVCRLYLPVRQPGGSSRKKEKTKNKDEEKGTTKPGRRKAKRAKDKKKR